MISLSIALKDLILNPTQSVDWQALPEEDILLYLGQIYDFLPAPIGIALDGRLAVIESPFVSQNTHRP